MQTIKPENLSAYDDLAPADPPDRVLRPYIVLATAVVVFCGILIYAYYLASRTEDAGLLSIRAPDEAWKVINSDDPVEGLDNPLMTDSLANHGIITDPAQLPAPVRPDVEEPLPRPTPIQRPLDLNPGILDPSPRTLSGTGAPTAEGPMPEAVATQAGLAGNGPSPTLTPGPVAALPSPTAADLAAPPTIEDLPDTPLELPPVAVELDPPPAIGEVVELPPLNRTNVPGVTDDPSPELTPVPEPTARPATAQPLPPRKPPGPVQVADVAPLSVSSDPPGAPSIPASAPSATPTAVAVATPPPSTVPGGGYKIQIGSFPQESLARQAWSTQQRRHPELASLPLIVEAASVRGATWYRVQAGPLSRQGANEVCAALKGRGTDCLVKRQ